MYKDLSELETRILRVLATQTPQSLDELRLAAGAVTEKALTRALKNLEAAGMISHITDTDPSSRASKDNSEQCWTAVADQELLKTVGASVTASIDPSHIEAMERVEQRWSGEPGVKRASAASAITLVAIAQLQTHDPVMLHVVTGFPVEFLAAVVWTVLHRDMWLHGDFAVLRECVLGEPEMDAELDRLLTPITTEVLTEQVHR